MNSQDIIFATYVTRKSGESWELVISAQMDVYFQGVDVQRHEELRRPGREVNDFIWKMEDITSDWAMTYGEGSASKRGGWIVILEEDRILHTWQGRNEYPVNWDEFCHLVAEFTDQPSLNLSTTL